MITSMTGFYEKIVTIPSGNQEQLPCFISIRSVNSRFLEIHCKVPPLLGFLEVPFIKLCKEKLKRGSITLTLHFFSEGSISQGNIRLRESLLQQYIDIAHIMTQKHSFIDKKLSVADILRIPGIIIAEDTINTAVRSLLVEELTSALDAVVKTRKEEGAALYTDIMQRLTIIATHQAEIAKYAALVMDARKKSIQEKLLLLEQTSPDLVNIHRTTLYLELDKADLHEELVRFENHYQIIKQYITQPEEEKGRRIDFIIQEMNREINTIAAKANDKNINTHAIEVKVELEKIREQSHNIL